MPQSSLMMVVLRASHSQRATSVLWLNAPRPRVRSAMTVCMLRPGHRKPRHQALRVVREADPVGAVGGLELPRGHNVGPGVSGDDRAVDEAGHLVAFHGERDLLRDGLTWGRRPVHRG